MFGSSQAVKIAKIDSQLDRQDEILDNIQETLKEDTRPSRDEYTASLERILRTENRCDELERKNEHFLWAIIGAYGALCLAVVAAAAVIISGVIPLIPLLHPAVH